jgi:hypothetical protein
MPLYRSNRSPPPPPVGPPRVGYVALTIAGVLLCGLIAWVMVIVFG